MLKDHQMSARETRRFRKEGLQMPLSLKLSQPKHPSLDLGAALAETAIQILCSKTVEPLEPAYWLRRKREEMAMAANSHCEEAKLVHLDLAGRYMVKAAGGSR